LVSGDFFSGIPEFESETSGSRFKASAASLLISAFLSGFCISSQAKIQGLLRLGGRF
jgi:hypothetical protein